MLTYKVLDGAQDQNDCYDLVLQATRALNYPGIEKLDEAHLYLQVSEYFRGDFSNRIMLGMFKDGLLVGILGGVKVPQHFFYKDTLAVETVWWVEEEHRGKGSIKLLEAYENWAKQVGCDYCTMSSVHFKDDKLPILYKRRGYKKVEESYMKELDK